MRKCYTIRAEKPRANAIGARMSGAFTTRSSGKGGLNQMSCQRRHKAPLASENLLPKILLSRYAKISQIITSLSVSPANCLRLFQYRELLSAFDSATRSCALFSELSTASTERQRSPNELLKMIFIYARVIERYRIYIKKEAQLVGCYLIYRVFSS